MWLGNTYLEKSILIIVIAVLLIIVGGGAAAFVLRPWDTTPDVIAAVQDRPEQTAPLPPDRPPGHGSTSGNILAGGKVVYSDGWIFRIEGTRTLVKTRVDGTDLQEIDVGVTAGGRILNLNVVDGWIYHGQENIINLVRGEVPLGIYRVRIDGTDLERIIDDTGLHLNVVDGWIYYPSQTSNRNLYRIRTDGTGRERLSDHAVNILQVMDGWVFYNLISQHLIALAGSPFTLIDDSMELTERSYIYKVRIDGTERTRISDVNSWQILAYDGWIYYTDLDNGLTLYRMRTDGTEVMRVVSDVVASPNIVDGWIYYAHIAHNHAYRNLFKIRPDGTGRQLVHDRRIEQFSIAGGWIFYTSTVGSPLRYKLSLDGTTRLDLRILRL